MAKRKTRKKTAAKKRTTHKRTKRKSARHAKVSRPTKFQRFLLTHPEEAKRKMGWK